VSPYGLMVKLRARDLLAALAVAVAQLVGSFGAASNQPAARSIDLFGVLLLLAGPLALLVRRNRPELPLFVSLAALVSYLGLDYAVGPIFLAFGIAVVDGVLRRRRLAVAVAVGSWEASVLIAAAVGEIGWGEVTGATAWTLVVVAVSEVVRVRRQGAEQERATAEQERLRVAGQQRLMIARELHDVLAHSISVISVQSGVALHLLDERPEGVPEQVRAALAAIRQASGDGLRDLQRTLDVLREQPARTPTPGLSELGRLLDGARASGLEVTCTVDGVAPDLTVPVGLAAYRVVQESLTNVSRHAGSPRARVRVTYADSSLEVRIDDDGPARRAGTGGGHGLLGMRERVAALGGTLKTGARPDGGFSVHAKLPT